MCGTFPRPGTSTFSTFRLRKCLTLFLHDRMPTRAVTTVKAVVAGCRSWASMRCSST